MRWWGTRRLWATRRCARELGDVYTEALRAAYEGRVPGGADLVCYWFEKARGQIERGGLLRAGLVATNSIRGGKNREVLGCDREDDADLRGLER